MNNNIIVCLTVMIGRNGPNISSSIIAASTGGSNKIVGSINLLPVFIIQNQEASLQKSTVVYIGGKNYINSKKGYNNLPTYKFCSSNEPP